MDITRVACEQREEQRRERDAAEVEQRRRDDARGNIAARKAARGGRRLHGRGQYAEEEETERERRRQQCRGGRLRGDRKSVVKGKSVSVRVDSGGRRINKKKK